MGLIQRFLVRLSHKRQIRILWREIHLIRKGDVSDDMQKAQDILDRLKMIRELERQLK